MTTGQELTCEYLECISCRQKYAIDDVRYSCECGDLLGIERPRETFLAVTPELFNQRLSSRTALDHSGVWRFREVVRNLPASSYVTHPEGNTTLYQRSAISQWSGVDAIYLKHEGQNPTGSFKDRGMTVAISQAKHLQKTIAACASTGNTSASLAAYAAQAGITPVVFLPRGKISSGKLAQALAYGATCLSIKGDFDSAMTLVQQAAKDLGIYMVNSLNPFRLEGQKTIIWELLQDLEWKTPDWIVVPGGNLGNTSAFGKALLEAYTAGWIAKIPRLATVQAAGANPFYLSFLDNFRKPRQIAANTYATAIQIGSPVNYTKAKKAIKETNGVVIQVSEQQIAEAKYFIDRLGIGCEPASACSLAGIRDLKIQGLIKPTDCVVGILTGNLLKDPTAAPTLLGANFRENSIIETEANITAIAKEIGKLHA